MFAQITIFQLNPGALDDLIRRFQDTIAQAVGGQPGFAGMTLLTDPATDRVLSVGLWETEADLLAGERSSYYQEQLARVKHLLAGPPIQEIYEVAVQVEITGPGTAHIRGI